MSWLIGLPALVIGFSTLVFVHELGHYALAKWNGVRVKVFSIGMGPYLVSFTIGETVYAISMVPIGGYVKMLGQEDMHPDIDPAKDPHDYRNKRPGQRAAILAAGAGFNLIFALFAFTFVYNMGVEMDAPKIGKVAPDSPLAKAECLDAQGRRVPCPLQKGDYIRSLDGVPMRTFMDVSLYVAGSGRDREIQIEYERDGHPVQNPVFVRTTFNADIGAPVIGMDRFLREETHSLGFEIQENQIFVAGCSPGTPSDQAGVKRGDRLISIDGKMVKGADEIVESINGAKGAEQTFLFDRNGHEEAFKIRGKEVDAGNGKKKYQIGMGMIFDPVKNIDERSEAYQAGLRKGFFITGVQKLTDNEHLEVAFTDLKNSDPKFEKTIIIPSTTVTSEGSPYDYTFSMPEQVEIKCDSMVESLALAWSDLLRHSTAVFTVVKGLMGGAISPKALSSPLGISAAILKVSVERPLIYYIWFLAFLSVNLGVLQFVPIPLLDGWHLVAIGLEKLKGGPLPIKFLIYSQWVGLVIILSLLALALFNDINRIF